MQKQQPTFHPITKAVTILEITRDMLDSSREQLRNMKSAKDRPYVLNEELISRPIKLYTEQNEDSNIFLQQCAIWRENELTEIQLYQVQEIENVTQELIKVNSQILSIVKTCKDFTIEKILEKDDVDLASEVLAGKIPLPK